MQNVLFYVALATCGALAFLLGELVDRMVAAAGEP